MKTTRANERAQHWGYAYRSAIQGPDAVVDLRRCAHNATMLRLDRKTQGLPELKTFRHLSTVVVHDATQQMIELLADVEGLRECQIWSGTAVSFEMLSGLKHLTKLWMRGNTKCVTVDGIASLRPLTHLALIHFPKIHDYSPLRTLGNLEALAIEGAWGPPAKIDSLAFVASLPKLRALHLTNARVADGKLQPLCSLRKLEYLACGKRFNLEEFAVVAKALPKLAKGYIAPYTELESPCRKCGRPSTVLLLGKGGRVLCKSCDASKIAEHVGRFQALQA